MEKKNTWWDNSLKAWHIYTSENKISRSLFIYDKDTPPPGFNVLKERPDQKYNKDGKKLRVNYLANKDILVQVILSKEQNKMNDELARMLQLLVHRISLKGNFCNYSYLDEMRSAAMVQLCTSWDKFDETRENPNPFAYYTTLINNSFIQVLNAEKKARNIRDKLLVQSGMYASDTYMNEQRDDVD